MCVCERERERESERGDCKSMDLSHLGLELGGCNSEVAALQSGSYVQLCILRFNCRVITTFPDQWPPDVIVSSG